VTILPHNDRIAPLKLASSKVDCVPAWRAAPNHPFTLMSLTDVDQATDGGTNGATRRLSREFAAMRRDRLRALWKRHETRLDAIEERLDRVAYATASTP